MNKRVQMPWRSRLTAAVGLGLTVAAAACSGGSSSATSPSGVTPSTLEAKGPDPSQDTRNFSVTVTPTSISAGTPAALHVIVTRNATSGQSQKLGSVEIYVPGAFTIQSVSGISNANWTSGVSGQTVRVGAVGGNHKLDGATDRSSVAFDINVTSTECGPHLFDTAKAANSTYADSFDPNWTYTGGVLSVTVDGCALPPLQVCDEPAAPAVANAYLRSIGVVAQDREKITEQVAQHMTEGARFDGIDKCDVAAYRAVVIAFVDKLL
jgi:hypothetical protein